MVARSKVESFAIVNGSGLRKAAVAPIDASSSRSAGEELWDADAGPKLVGLAKVQNVPTDLPNALFQCSRAFERLRYAYETTVTIALERELNCVEKILIPEWFG
jgi:hypothetical protein